MQLRSRPTAPNGSRRFPLAALGSVVALLAGLLVGSGVATAAAAPFQAGNIISDANFYDPSSMSTTDVAAFLQAKGASCASRGPACLKDYRQSTSSRAATRQCPGDYQGAGSETAAAIITKVAGACGISPKVLLVMLQKEQGLVTSSGPSQRNYDAAMGQGCPDTAACDTTYNGFSNQVYGAASQLQWYRLEPNRYAYRAGLTNTILFNPSSACGSSRVFVENQATAGLYNYTPYQPNAAALAAGYGAGDSCSAYGNRNFVNYYTAWFGPPVLPNRPPVGAVDELTWNAAAGTIVVRGWGFDPDAPGTSTTVRVLVDGTPVSGPTAAPRADVNRAYSIDGVHGYTLSVPVSNAEHQVCVSVLDVGYSSATALGCRQAGNLAPVGALDATTFTSDVNGTGSGILRVQGWALDPTTSSTSIPVHVYVDGIGTPASTGLPRGDVNRAYGVSGAHGYDIAVAVPAGDHRVCVYAIDTSRGPNPALSCASFNANALPLGNLEQVRADGRGGVTVRGWSLDPDVRRPIPVHVYVDGAGYVLGADRARPDVDAAYPGVGGSHGFADAVPLPRGSHRVCAYGIDTAAGNTVLGCAVVTG